MNTVFLSLGSNIGDRQQNLLTAINHIAVRIGHVQAQSAFIVTTPWGYVSDNNYLNAALKVTTTLEPFELLKATQQIERDMGRTHKTLDGNYQDRIIDIDILLFYNGQQSVTVNSPTLTIPHPLMHQRDFVLTPLKEIL